VTFGRDPTQVIPAVVAGTETVLRAASKVPSVKRVVLTSSSVAAALLEPGEGDVLLSQGQYLIKFALTSPFGACGNGSATVLQRWD
jgi:hypothetical protein